MLEDLCGQVLAEQEEIEMANSEETNGSKPMDRIDRAGTLDKEAQVSFDRKEYMMIKPKITAARNLVEKIREALSESQSGDSIRWVFRFSAAGWIFYMKTSGQFLYTNVAGCTITGGLMVPAE